jgi:hypothetical protein
VAQGSSRASPMISIRGRQIQYDKTERDESFNHARCFLVRRTQATTNFELLTLPSDISRSISQPGSKLGLESRGFLNDPEAALATGNTHQLPSQSRDVARRGLISHK